MEIRFVKMIQFTRLISAAGRLREFNFRQFNKDNPASSGFSVDVVDDRGERIMFSMAREEKGWKIPGRKIPDWILSKEKMLGETIEEVTSIVRREA